MRERKVVCLFCRHNSISRPSLRISQRWKTYPTRHEREPYVLPRLVIDLDAADNPHVKDFDELPKDEQERNLKSNLFRRVEVKQGDPAKYLKPIAQPSWDMFNKDRDAMKPIDLVIYTLLGESNTSHSWKSKRARIFHITGTQPQDEVLRNVQEVAQTLVVDDEIRLRKAWSNFTEEDIDELRTTIEHCEHLENLQLLITTYSSTKKGCECLAGMGDAISSSIRLCQIGQGKSSHFKLPNAQILRMLNNLHLKMKSKGVEFGSSLCNRALYYAAKVGSLPAVKMYLELAQRNSYDLNLVGSQAPIELIIAFLEFESRSHPASSNFRMYKKDFITLLTGYEDGLPKEGIEQEASLRSTFKDNQISHKSALYRRYLLAIAQLGLGDVLWAEWKLGLEGGSDLNSKKPKSEIYNTERAHIFALAFSIAGDSKRALEILEMNSFHTLKSEKRDLSKTARTDMSKLLKSMIHDYYNALNLSAVPAFWQRVGRDLAAFPEHETDAVDLLNRYLLSGYKRGVQNRKVDIRKLDFGEILMVFPLKGGGPLFAKSFIED